MSDEEKMTLEKFRKEWKNFKRMRDKKKFNTYNESGWLSFMKREEMLDFLINLFDKSDDMMACA